MAAPHPLLPTASALVLTVGLMACGQPGVAAPQSSPLIGAWSLDLEPLLLDVGYPVESVDALIGEGFWTWYFDADGELALHRLLDGEEELRRGQWAPASDAPGLVRIDLDQGEAGLELDYELLDGGRLRAQFVNYEQLPSELYFQRADRAQH